MRIDVYHHHESIGEHEEIRTQLDRIESLMLRLADDDSDRDTAKELTGAVAASTKELKDAMAATPTTP